MGSHWDVDLVDVGVRGVGPDVAQAVAFQFGYPDAHPALTRQLRQSLARAAGRPLTARQVDDLFEGWRPHPAQVAALLLAGPRPRQDRSSAGRGAHNRNR